VINVHTDQGTVIFRFTVICGFFSLKAIFPVRGALVGSKDILNEELILKSRNNLYCVFCFSS
jgi:hypothetical protein